MRSMYFTMSNINDIKMLVNLAHEVDGEVLIKKGNYIIDASSIMGVFSIDLTGKAEITYPENATKLEEFIEKFQA